MSLKALGRQTEAGRVGTLNERVFDLALLGFFCLGLAYLFAKTALLAQSAGYDFRYMWLAGKVWLDGANPYGPEYHELGTRIITFRHVPTLWPYPPNWFLPSVLLAQADLDRAAFIANIVNVVMMVGASALLTAALQHRHRHGAVAPGPMGWLQERLARPRNAFFLHLGAMAGLQATALVLSTGQNSILIYFGASLLIYGLAKERQMVAVLGLVLTLLKPQVGGLFAVLLLFDRRHWGLVAKAAAISLLMALPALLVSSTAPFDWLRNLGLYDGMNTANAPQASTGMRNLVFDLASRDIGNMAGAAIALVVGVGLCALACGSGKRRNLKGADLAVLAAAVAAALAPLHHYDLVLVGAVLFTGMQGRALERGAALVGVLLLWRADDLARVTHFYDPGAEHFVGSRAATIGALLLLFAAYRAMASRAREGAVIAGASA